MKIIYTIISFLVLSIGVASAQYRAVGVVKNPDGETISDVNLSLISGNDYTTSDRNGKFYISLTQFCDTLVATGVHIKRVEQPICSGDSMIFIVETLNNHLDEVVVLGYSQTTQRYLVGSVTKISKEEIANQPLGNPLMALQGRVPGMTVSATNGLPGAAVSIQVRGQNAIKPDQHGSHYIDPPLFIVDGIPFSPQNQNINQYQSATSPRSFENVYGGISPFNSIDPQSIESIEVLKDAEATAIYGSRGGNGVVLITTKAGRMGKTQLDAKLDHGISRKGRTMPMMNTAQYLELRKEAYTNDGIQPDLRPGLNTYAPDLLVFDPNVSQDWENYFLGNTAQNTQANVTLSGGNENTRFLLGSTFRRDTYIYPGNFADWKASFNSNLRHQSPDNRFSLNLSILYSYNNNTSVGTTDIIGVYRRMPNYPDLLDDQGNLVWSYGGLDFITAPVANPLSYLFHPYEMKTTMLNAGMNIDYRLTEGLKGRVNMGYSTLGGNEWSAYTNKGSNPFNHLVQRTATFGTNDFFSWIVEPQLIFDRMISKGNLEVLLGTSFQWDKNRMTSIRTEGHLDDNLLRSITAAPTSSATDRHSEYKFMAVFGRASYIWDRKFITNISFRKDGSSKFGPEKRFGNFGSIGAGWIFIDQPDQNQNRLINFGKLRGSWGVTGSDNTSSFQYISRWSPIPGAYQGQMGYAPQNLFNAELGWASTTKLEFGLDLGLLENRLYTTASWYRNRSDNQLINYTLPTQTGFGSVAMNWNALVQNSGWEISLDYRIYDYQKFHWSIGANVSFPKNVLKRFDGIETSSYATTYIVGKSLNLLLGYEYAGVNPETGVFEYYNAAGDKVPVPTSPSSGQFNDYTYLGNLDPKYYGGFQNQFRYKDLSLDIFIEFKSRMGANFLRYVYSGSVVGGASNVPAVLEDRWRNPGDDARFMKATTIQGSRNRTNQLFPLSSGAYGDATYMRVKFVNLVWRLPLMEKWKENVTDATLSLGGYNLFTFTSYEGNDPETLGFYSVPPLRTFNIGLQVKF